MLGECLWGASGMLWAHFGDTSGRLPGCFGAALGALWADLWLLWGRFGTALGPLWDHFGDALGPLWGCFGAALGPWLFGALGLFILHCFWALLFRESIPAAGTEGSSVLFVSSANPKF